MIHIFLLTQNDICRRMTFTIYSVWKFSIQRVCLASFPWTLTSFGAIVTWTREKMFCLHLYHCALVTFAKFNFSVWKFHNIGKRQTTLNKHLSRIFLRFFFFLCHLLYYFICNSYSILIAAQNATHLAKYISKITDLQNFDLYMMFMHFIHATQVIQLNGHINFLLCLSFVCI